MSGCLFAFAEAIIKAPPYDDRMLRSWLLKPLVLPASKYEEEMRRAHKLANAAFQIALEVLRMDHVVQNHVKHLISKNHAKWLEQAIHKNEIPKELYGKARTTTATKPGFVLACIDLYYHAPMIPAPKGSEYKWIYDPIQELKSAVISYASDADIWGLTYRDNHWEKEPCRPNSAGEHAGKAFAAYAQLIGNQGYELAAEAMRSAA